MPAAPQNAEPSSAAPARGLPQIARLAPGREVAPLAGAIGLFFAGRGAVAIVINQVTGWVSGKLPGRRFVIGVSGAVGAIGALGFALLRGYVEVLIVGAVAFGIGGVCFSQLFAYTKELAQEQGRPVTAFMSVVRAVFSAAWVIGPPAGLFVLARYGFGPLYLATAGLSLVTAVLGRWCLPQVPS